MTKTFLPAENPYTGARLLISLADVQAVHCDFRIDVHEIQVGNKWLPVREADTRECVRIISEDHNIIVRKDGYELNLNEKEVMQDADKKTKEEGVTDTGKEVTSKPCE